MFANTPQNRHRASVLGVLLYFLLALLVASSLTSCQVTRVVRPACQALTPPCTGDLAARANRGTLAEGAWVKAKQHQYAGK